MRNNFSILRLFVCFILTTVSNNVLSQDIEVKKFELLEKDQTAALSPRKDINGVTCGLVKVALKEPGAEFEGSVMGDVQFTGKEYLVYLPNGTKRLGIKHPDYLPTTIVFADYGTKKVASSTTYELKVKANKKKAKVDDSKKGMAIFNIKPSNAMLLIDGQIADGSSGAYTLSLPYGTHYYTVKYKLFSLNNIQVKIDKNPKTFDIDLTEYFAKASITCQEAGADLYIDNELRSKENWKGLLPPGNYSIECKKEGYHTLAKTIELKEDGEMIVDFPRMKLIAGTLIVQTEPKGADIFLNGEKVGNTPWKNLNIPVGRYDLVISSQYYLPLNRSITINEDQELNVNDNLVPTQLGKLIMDAQNGNGYAQGCLADMYEVGSENILNDEGYWEYSEYALDTALAKKEGYKIEKDITQCVYWLKKRVETFKCDSNQNFVKSTSNRIMLFYLKGEGVKQDFNESFKWANIAGDWENYWLAWHYFYGRGVKKNNDKALYYLNNLWGGFGIDCNKYNTINKDVLNKVGKDIPRIKEVLDIIGYN